MCLAHSNEVNGKLVMTIFESNIEDSCVTLSHISDPQDCSLGQLIRPLNESNRINGGGGTYFLPDEVSCSGSLVSVHTCFFYNDEGNNRFRLRVSVFRRMGNRYTRQNFTNIRTRRDNSSVTQSCTSRNLTDPLPVLEGDRLAVQILDGCTNNNVCPLQPNLNISAETLVFYTPSFSVRMIPVSQVMATEDYTNVYLDVSASIGKLNVLHVFHGST